MKRIVVFLGLFIIAGACAHVDQSLTDEDIFLWLEEVEGERALAWVEEQNALSIGYLEALENFGPLYARNLEIYDSEERVAWPSLRGKYVYNFWRDASQPRGLWRRTSLDAYVAGESDW